MTTSVAQAIAIAADAAVRGMAGAFPARVDAFDAKKKAVTVTPLRLVSFDDGQAVASAAVANVPVVYPRGGGFAIEWPLAAGDTVLVVPAFRSLDEWKRIGTAQRAADPRAFDVRDFIAIPGVLPPSAPGEPVIDGAIAIRGGRVIVDARGAKVVIENDAESLATLIADLITAVKGLSVTVPALGLSAPPMGGPVTGQATGTVASGDQTALQQIATRFDKLLETL